MERAMQWSREQILGVVTFDHYHTVYDFKKILIISTFFVYIVDTFQKCFPVTLKC